MYFVLSHHLVLAYYSNGYNNSPTPDMLLNRPDIRIGGDAIAYLIFIGIQTAKFDDER